MVGKVLEIVARVLIAVGPSIGQTLFAWANGKVPNPPKAQPVPLDAQEQETRRRAEERARAAKAGPPKT